MAAQLATKPDRARLLAQLRNVEAQLAKLDLEEQQQQQQQPKTVPAAANKVQDVKLNKRARKALARQGESGPLPPSLASAPKRHIALLFSYEGWAHSGLAYQPKGVYTPLPTVEGCLLAALEKARLIEPIEEGEGFGCGFERCGRTDAGVSSSAQVVNLWVRSDLEDPMQVNGREIDPESVEGRRHARSRSRSRSRSSSTGDAESSTEQPTPAKKRNDVEIPYVTLLNKHLPPSIRIHAWSPVSATFSSRYSCIWRHYKYFFSTSPSSALLATRFDFGAAYQALDHGRYPEHANSDWRERLAGIDWHGLDLDVDLMREAVRRLVGEHDFRNFCKVDPPKQLPIHVRTVLSATIDPLEGEGDDMFVLNLRGGAFLYNQVRHIVAILFLVGARLEPPSIVDRLLWTSDRTPHTIATSAFSPPASTSPDSLSAGNDTPVVEVLDRKPGYQMASDLPLILWQCGFNSHEFTWRIDNVPLAGDVNADILSYIDHNGRERQPVDRNETFRKQYLEMRETFLEAKLKSIALKHHLASFAFLAPTLPEADDPELSNSDNSNVRYTPLGAGHHLRSTSYIPLLKRQRAELPEVLNARWAAGRGKARIARREETKERSDREREANLKIREAAFELAEAANRRIQTPEEGGGSQEETRGRSPAVSAESMGESGASGVVTPVKGEA